MANGSGDADFFFGSGRMEFDFDLRSYGQVRDGEQAHADIAEIDAERLHLRGTGENLHGGVQQLALPATAVFEVAFEHALPIRSR